MTVPDRALSAERAARCDQPGRSELQRTAQEASAACLDRSTTSSSAGNGYASGTSRNKSPWVTLGEAARIMREAVKDY
jgi:hypothetical protein